MAAAVPVVMGVPVALVALVLRGQVLPEPLAQVVLRAVAVAVVFLSAAVAAVVWDY